MCSCYNTLEEVWPQRFGQAEDVQFETSTYRNIKNCSNLDETKQMHKQPFKSFGSEKVFLF